MQYLLVNPLDSLLEIPAKKIGSHIRLFVQNWNVHEIVWIYLVFCIFFRKNTIEILSNLNPNLVSDTLKRVRCFRTKLLYFVNLEFE